MNWFSILSMLLGHPLSSRQTVRRSKGGTIKWIIKVVIGMIVGCVLLVGVFLGSAIALFKYFGKSWPGWRHLDHTDMDGFLLQVLAGFITLVVLLIVGLVAFCFDVASRGKRGQKKTPA